MEADHFVGCFLFSYFKYQVIREFRSLWSDQEDLYKDRIIARFKLEKWPQQMHYKPTNLECFY